MDRRIYPGALSGTVAAIPSKSDAHRRLICAALAQAPSRVELADGSRDIEATAAALGAFGARLCRDSLGYAVTPCAAAAGAPCVADCGESGSTLRFLLPVAAALGLRATFVGGGRLPERPMAPLCALLRAHGAAASADRLPITLSGRLQSGRYALPGNVSSQYISGLLFALPLLVGDSEIVLTAPLESAGYVEMTLRALAAYGVAVQKTAAGWHVPGGQHYRAPRDSRVEGDWSNAAFWVAAGALGGEIAIRGLPQETAQGDSAAAALAAAYGASVERRDGLLCVRAGAPRTAPMKIDARDIPDLVPALAVLACGARCETVIAGCARLRLKESDRVAAVCGLIGGLGGDARADGDSILVRGTGALRGGEADSQNDHRIAMAAAVAAALCREPVVLHGAQAVEKSYPGFWRDFEALGGKTDVL